MNLKALTFKTFFGGKPWYKSLVGWGALVLLVAETAVPAAGELGLADPDQMSILTSYMEKLSVLLGALGIRRRLPATGTIAAVSLVALLSLGCAKMVVTTVGPNGEPVTVELRTGGRSCVAATVNADGTVDAVGSQDASSDWLSLRIIPATLQTALVTFFGAREPALVGVSGPSTIGGCDGVFTQTPLVED